MRRKDILDRREFVKGTLAAGAAIAVAGCGGSGGDSADITYGETVEGEITEDSPTDPVYADLAKPYTFEGSEGDTVTITMTSEQIDTYLILMGPDDGSLEQNDDGGTGTNSRLRYTMSINGVYTIWAGSFSGTATGEFTLSIEEGA